MDCYKILPLQENLWAVSEVGKTVMYVMNGREKALLLDTGFGLTPLRQVVRRLCGEKPVLVVNSHGHIDHNSGNNQFETVYAGRYDEPDSHAELSEQDKAWVSETFFREFLEAGGVLPPWNPGPARRVLPLQEGDVLELGGLSLQVLETPGHSLGSIALYEEKQRWLFTGDLILTWEVWGQLERSTALQVYGQSLRRLAGLAEQVDAVFPAHWEEKRNPLHLPECRLPPGVLLQYAEGTERILCGREAGQPYPFRGKTMRCAFFPVGGMVFDPERLGRPQEGGREE